MGVSPLQIDTYELRSGDALQQLRLLPDASIQTCLTSPPYFALRKYNTAPQIWGGDADCVHEWGPEIAGDARGGSGPRSKAKRSGDSNSSYGRNATRGRFCGSCDAWEGELGLEPTPSLFVEHLVEICREIRRVLRDDGTFFLNIADTFYSGALKGHPDPWKLKKKDLCGVPQRLVLALQEDGWYWRSDGVWSKAGGNCPRCHYRIEKGSTKPESVKDRFTRSHEFIFLLAKSKKYYFDVEAVKAKHTTSCRRDVFHISSQNFRGAHYATMPMPLAEIGILGGTSEHGACAKCRAPYKRITQKGAADKEKLKAMGGDAEGNYTGENQKDYAGAGAEKASDLKRRILAGAKEILTTGWAQTCKCVDPGDPVPCLVLDPFSGCYDEKTKVLTKRGFIPWSEVHRNDEFATRSTTGEISYAKARRLIDVPYQGTMHHYEGRSLDLLVTPDHKMLVREHHADDYQLIPSNEMSHRCYHIPNKSFWYGTNKDQIQVGELTLPADAWLRFVGLFIAEGWIRWTGRGHGVYVNQSKSKEAVEAVSEVFSALRDYGRHRSHTYGKKTIFVLQHSAIHEYCKHLKKQHERFIPRELLELDSSALTAILEGLMLGDGSFYGKNGKTRISYYTSSPRLAENVAELLIKLGYAATISKRWRRGHSWRGRWIEPKQPEYCITARYAKETKIDTFRMRKEISYSGRVYCAEVPPNHTLLVERNGKIAWCGNSATTGAVALRHGRSYLGLELLKENNTEISVPRLDAVLESLKAPVEIDYLPLTSGIYHGASEILLHRVVPNSVRLILTDPPYNVSQENNFHTMGRTGINFAWDGDFDQETWIRLADKALMPGGSIVIWNDWKVLGLIAHLLIDMGYAVKRPLTWIKSNPWPRNQERVPVQRIESGLWAVKPKGKWVQHRRLHHAYEDLIFRYAVPQITQKEKDAGRIRHDTKKPDDMFREIIQIFSDPGDLILDPFVGGGTTAYAAEAEGRRHISFELDPENEGWFKEAVDHWERGKTAPPLVFPTTPEEKARAAHADYKKLCKKLRVHPVTFEHVPKKTRVVKDDTSVAKTVTHQVLRPPTGVVTRDYKHIVKLKGI